MLSHAIGGDELEEASVISGDWGKRYSLLKGEGITAQVLQEDSNML